VSERVLSSLPLRGPQARWSARLEERKVDVDRASTYVELYGAYAETEASFAVDRLLERWGSLDEADRGAFCFDPRVIDWEQYVTTIHLPSVVAHARVKTTPGASNRQSRSSRLPSTSRTR
jgi:hypothetical protein